MQWEYKTIRLSGPVSDYTEGKVQQVLDNLGAQLNEAGQDGWELVSTLDTAAHGYTNFVIAILKRPKQ